MNEMFYISIDELGVSQLYLNQEKIDNVLAWFNPLIIDEYEPLPVHDFSKKGKYVLKDGHTRAYVLYKSGVSQIPVVIDNDEIVACDFGIKSYKEYIEWCNRLCINTVKDLENRIVTNQEYEFLWIERCDRLYNFMIKIDEGMITLEEYVDLKKIGEDIDLNIYGCDKDVSTYYYESASGDLWTYNNRQFTLEV